MHLTERVRRSLRRIEPAHVLGACLLYLALCWLVFLGVDTWDWFGVRRTGAVEEGGHGLLWLTIFTNGGPTEWLQWSMLGAAGVVAAWVAGSLRGIRGQGPVLWFWLLMSVAFTIMLIEDAGELRQQMWRLVEASVESRAVYLGVELVQFIIIASVPLYALWRYGRRVIAQRGIGIYVLAGFLCYAIAGGASATRNWGGEEPIPGWYTVAGETIHGWIGGVMSHPTYEQELVYFLLMDRVFEESVELLGAGFFLVATLMAARYVRARAAGTDEGSLGEAA